MPQFKLSYARWFSHPRDDGVQKDTHSYWDSTSKPDFTPVRNATSLTEGPEIEPVIEANQRDLIF